MNDIITLALSKGRIFDETRPLLAAAGIAEKDWPALDGRNLLPQLLDGTTGSPRQLFWRHKAQDQRAAMRACLKFFGEAAGEIGFTKPLGNYSEAEALQVIDAIVTCYTETMVEHHETTKFPPVRGLPPARDVLVGARDPPPAERIPS